MAGSGLPAAAILGRMQDKDLFGLALGLSTPWFVSSVEFEPEQRRLELLIDFERGGAFPCSECGAAGCKAYDTEEKSWRHLNFFQFETHLQVIHGSGASIRNAGHPGHPFLSREHRPLR